MFLMDKTSHIIAQDSPRNKKETSYGPRLLSAEKGKRCVKKIEKSLRKGVDERKGACYIMTVALMRDGALDEHCFFLDRRGMYPENYTMQNMLEMNLTSQMQHR